MSSRSIGTRSKWQVVGLLVLGLVLGTRGTAAAGRRIVVLEFDGPKAERFRTDVEAAVKKGNTIVSLDKWNAKAEDLGATKVTARNIKKVAAKLEVDGVIVGEVEKRGPRYYLHLKLREGESGQFVAESEVVVRTPKLGGDGAKVVKDELMPAIRELNTNSSGGDDEEEEDEEPVARKKSKKGKKTGFGRRDPDDEEEDEEAEEEEEEEEPVARKKKARKKAKKVEEEEEEEEEDEEPVARKKAKKTKKARKPPPDEEEEEEEEDDDEEVASADDDEEEDDEEGEVRARRDDDDGEELPPDPRFPALEVAAGLSATMRKLDLGSTQQGYNGQPVAGAMFTADVYPLAFNKKNKSITRHIGLTVLFDRVITITSRIKYEDPADPANQLTAELPTTQQRYAVGLVFRYPIGEKASVEGSLRYNRMKFVIDKEGAPVMVTIPNVDYAFVDPGVGFRYVVSPKIVAAGRLAFMLVTGTGELQEPDQYGGTKTLGFDLEGGASYAVTPKILIHADLRMTTLGLSFDGSGTLSNPEGDAMVEVPSGRDTYFGGAVTAGYLF